MLTYEDILSGSVPAVDPTRIHMDTEVNDWNNPLVARMRGYAYHGNTPFDVPFISHIEGNLWQGGCERGLILPSFFENVVSLYVWEKYAFEDPLEPPAVTEVVMYDDSSGPDHANVLELATLVQSACKSGPTLVHCQAGLNRSSLIAGAALMLGLEEGPRTAEEAISLLREKRSPACLCNKTFESFLLNDFRP